MRQLASLAAAASVLASAGPSLASSGVSFANLKGGEALRSPVHVEFAVQGYQVRPASEGLQEGSGHFHVLIDAEDAVEEGVTIPVIAISGVHSARLRVCSWAGRKETARGSRSSTRGTGTTARRSWRTTWS